MEKFKLENDIRIFYVTATSFPEGIQDAHDRIHERISSSSGRKYFGVSRPENGKIVYHAGTEETFPGEAEKYYCETLTIKSGEYISIVIRNFKQNLPSIRKAFEELLQYPGIDPEGYCVEWYSNDNEEVRCMVRLVGTT